MNNSYWPYFSPQNIWKSAGSKASEEIQDVSDIPWDTHERPPTKASEEAPTPRSFSYTPTVSSTDASSFCAQSQVSPMSPIDESLDADYLEDRLRKLKAIEAIEIIERRRSLHLSELAAPKSEPMDNSLTQLFEALTASNRLMSNSQALLATSTSSIAKNQKIAAEKEANENSKLKSLETVDILHFIAHLNPKSCQPIWKQVPIAIHDSLALDLAIPIGETLESTYGEEIGIDSRFVEALYQLVASRPNLDPKELLKSHAMPEKPSLDRTALLKMFAVTQREIKFHPKIYHVLSLVETKRALVSNIRPTDFRQAVESYADRYMCPLVTISDMVTIIMDQYQRRESFLQYSQRYGAPALADSALLGLAATIPTEDVKTVSKKITCFNCSKKGHSATECRAPCKFHPGVKCADKMACYREDRAATKKAKAAVASDVRKHSPLVCSSTHQPPSSRADEFGLIDSGCNILCLPAESNFDILHKSTQHSNIQIADGKSVPIKGYGKICDKEAKFVPDFDKALVPLSTFTDYHTGIISRDGINIVPTSAFSSICDIVDLLSNSKKIPGSTFIKQVNGVYPISLSQLRTLCTMPDMIASHTAAVANSSYFTAKLDSIGELVYFWHCAWNHLSKKR